MQYRDFLIDIDAKRSVCSYFVNKEKKGGKLELSDKLKEDLKDFLDPEPEEEWTKNSVINFGSDLRNALLKGEVSDQFDSALETVEAEGLGLRIVLRIDPAYAGYPWEVMSKDGTPLSTDLRTPIVRGLKGANNSINLGKQPLRILVVASEPKTTPGIDAKDEIERIEKELLDEESLKADFIDRGTRSNIDNKVKKRNYNIIHFIGHGAFDTNKQKGLLLLMKENGYPLKADETEIKNIFLNQSKVGLMLLNACDTSAESKELSGGLVPKLIERIPAIIAMRGRVSSEASATFSHACYVSLSAINKTLEEIVQDARRTMFTTGYHDKDWRDFSIPVLFMGLGRNEAKPAVVTSRFGNLFKKSYPQETPHVSPSMSRKEEPAVKVLTYFMNTVYDDLHSLQNIVDDCFATLAVGGGKADQKRFIKEVRQSSKDLDTHITDLGNKILDAFPDAYQNIADTKTLLKNNITALKRCFSQIRKNLEQAEETMGSLQAETENLYVETVKGILKKYSKGNKGDS